MQSSGEYVSMDNGRKFATQEDFSKIQEGMSYDQVVSVLGKEHEQIYYLSNIIDEELNIVETESGYEWYAQGGLNSIYCEFIDGRLDAAYMEARADGAVNFSK